MNNFDNETETKADNPVDVDQAASNKEVLKTENDDTPKTTVQAIPPKRKKWDDPATEQLLALWGDSDTLPDRERWEKIDEISKIMGRSDKAILMKLAREKVYTPRTYQHKTGEVNDDDGRWAVFFIVAFFGVLGLFSYIVCTAEIGCTAFVFVFVVGIIILWSSS